MRLGFLFRAFVCILPWPLRRWVLRTFYGYQIHKTARMGLCFVFPRHLIMEERAIIGHLTVCVYLDMVHLKSHASIGRGNWITGYPTNSPDYFFHQTDRRAELIVGEHSAITNRHIVDCTNRVSIGRFSTFAGFRSQILAHSIDIEKGRQSSKPVTIGDYCFVGTDCVLLGGCSLPDYSILGAKSLLTHAYVDKYMLYGGVPARPIREMAKDCEYFKRPTGHVG